MAKKTPPKKAIAKKKTSTPKKTTVKKTVKKPSIVDEAASEAFSTTLPESPFTPEAGTAKQDGKRFPLVVIVLLVIGVIVFLNYLNKKKSAAHATAPASVEEAAKPAEMATVATGEWQKEINDAKNWADANSMCEKNGMKLPTKDELLEYRKVAAKETENMGRLWTSTADGKDYVTVFMKSGSTSSRPKTKKFKSVCKK